MPYVDLKVSNGHRFEIPSTKATERHYLVLDQYSHVFENNAFIFSGNIEVRNASNNELMYTKYDKWVGDKFIFICIDPNHALYKKQLNVRGESLMDIINRLNPPPPKPRDLLENETPDAQWLAEQRAYESFNQWSDLPFNYTDQYSYIYKYYIDNVKPMFADFLSN